MPTTTFQVSVGHWHLEVEAVGTEEAIDAARRQLRRQLPRLWDVIESLPRDRFTVRLLTEASPGAAAPLRLRSA